MTRDQSLDMKSRQSWFKTYTDAARALNQALRDREEKDWEKRLQQIEEYWKKQSLASYETNDSDPPTGSSA
jgi:hypothetical protein